MKFILLDKVMELEVGRRIVAVKAVTMAEEYLADHFPSFPVLPGVMIIEGLVQTAAMLVRVTNNFRQSIIVLEEARNVKYKSFVKPGNLLRMEVQAKNIEEDNSTFTGVSYVGEQLMVEARIKLKHFNLSEGNARLEDLDSRIKQEMRHRAKLVGASL